MGENIYASLSAALAEHGLILRGGFVATPDDAVPEAGEGRAAHTVILVGNAGPSLWAHFAPHAEAGPNPLDRWTVSVVAPVAARFGARAVYPFEKPHMPFQRWARKAEAVHSSPLGVLVHPDHGLWHAYRAALLFASPVALPAPDLRPSPCASCAGRPCLSACPVGAFTEPGYDVPACAAHLASPAGFDCHDLGCRARAACPVGQPYAAEQIRFHMTAFHRAVCGD